MKDDQKPEPHTIEMESLESGLEIGLPTVTQTVGKSLEIKWDVYPTTKPFTCTLVWEWNEEKSFHILRVTADDGRSGAWWGWNPEDGILELHEVMLPPED